MSASQRVGERSEDAPKHQGVELSVGEFGHRFKESYKVEVDMEKEMTNASKAERHPLRANDELHLHFRARKRLGDLARMSSFAWARSASDFSFTTFHFSDVRDAVAFKLRL